MNAKRTQHLFCTIGKSCVLFLFSSKGRQTDSVVFPTFSGENTRRFPKGAEHPVDVRFAPTEAERRRRRSPFGSGSSNRREKRPVGMGFHRGTAFHLAHDFPQESLVCYTFCDRWRGKGTAGAKIVMNIRAVQRLLGDSRTEDICNAA